MDLYSLALETLFDLASEKGINASGKDEIFGCIFGRDSAITILKILNSYNKKPNKDLLDLCKKALLTLVDLQGNEFNIESGEEPGKFIHEYRTENFQHLLDFEKPWFVYSDNTIKSYDSIDSTPLTLIAIFKYWQISKDTSFLTSVLPAVEKGLNWIITFGDQNKDQLIEYTLPPERKHGGLLVQSWTDSHESLRQADGVFPKYPIAPVEAQGIAWLSLKLWSDAYQGISDKFSKNLTTYAKKMKKDFNDKFIFFDGKFYFAGQAIDGDKNLIKTVTANPLICLWAGYKNHHKKYESIIENVYINDIVKRAFLPDMFVSDAGIRTMSSLSPTFNPGKNSYHNGSFWPMLNGLAIEGLENFGFVKEASQLKEASIKSLEYFGTPLEVYVKTDEGLSPFSLESGQTACSKQAWSAAALLDMVS